MVESFNANFVEVRAPNGLPYTPYFNSLIPQGLYVDRFYGNSVQTSKGQFATLCSLLPAMEGREFVQLAEVQFRCLPEILSKSGFETLFFQAYSHINYDNTRNFLKHIGFARVETVDDHKHEKDGDSTWGWGLQDDVFYQRFFEYLDKIYDKNDRPLFVTLAPISNHMRFGDVPKSERAIYPEPNKPEEKYANTINVADRGLKVFLQELRRREQFRDALVIITGDHSFPVGEHGYHHNETNAYEEFFRIPFLMLAPGQIEAERVQDVAYSQLDIAPTLLDYTGIQPVKNHFMGVSLFARPYRQHVIPLMQPYSGRYLGVIDFPYKYVFRMRDERDRLVNLALDPHEEHNLASEAAYDARRAEMHRMLEMHKLTATACVHDQVWPHAAE
jgi:phosphoglycerol transferase MdoB-like AlkP superfamily enzyme